jgi:hypothetical protein
MQAFSAVVDMVVRGQSLNRLCPNLEISKLALNNGQHPSASPAAAKCSTVSAAACVLDSCTPVRHR